jgi:hypothetical protein
MEVVAALVLWMGVTALIWRRYRAEFYDEHGEANGRVHLALFILNPIVYVIVGAVALRGRRRLSR